MMNNQSTDIMDSVTNSEHQRALKKIDTLQKTIEFLKSSHSERIKGLHEEIGRLQTQCSNNTLSATFQDLKSVKFSTNSSTYSEEQTTATEMSNFIPEEILELRRGLKRAQREARARQEETTKLKQQLIIMGQKMEKLVMLLKKRSAETVLEVDPDVLRAAAQTPAPSSSVLAKSQTMKAFQSDPKNSNLLPYILPGSSQVLRQQKSLGGAFRSPQQQQQYRLP